MPLTAFHPTIQRWFAQALGAPSAPQLAGWPKIRAGHHVLIAAPTGSGKTLAAFLVAIDGLLKQGSALSDTTQVLYVSPLKALSNDVQKNLALPLAQLQALDTALPRLRVQVRSGDTPARERAAMLKSPPHILVTTPESLYLLLTTVRGRIHLANVRTLIVDEIHALARDKRGSHLALSLERLEHLVRQNGGAIQRIGLSATQRPIEQTAGLLVGSDRACEIIDTGHRRELDLGIEVPGAPLTAVCGTDTWTEIYRRMQDLILSHRTTLVFVNTRKMAERVAARLAETLGKELVTSHHGSLSKQRRLDAEQRLKQGELRALVATASLELGIDIGDVDLVLQIGPTTSIATLLQRVGRAGHGLGRLPKGRIFPLTRDELCASAALLHAVRKGDLDHTIQPNNPLDILAQQIVATAIDGQWPEEALYALCRAAWPFRTLERATFDAVLSLHAQGRHALLHRDPVHRTVRGTKRARLTAVTCGGAIPDNADYRVVLDHDETLIGTVNEDFAIESSIGDVFQLGNTSWQVRRIGQGVLRVADAQGVPPSLPFWRGEAPSRSDELSIAISTLREHGEDQDWLLRECGINPDAAEQIVDYLRAGRLALGAMPTRDQLVLERFFDETGGQQLVLHSPFGSRINRAFGLALRKRFCTGFGYELQAAATEEALLISLGPMHSFTLPEVFDYLHPNTAIEVLIQALIAAPMFQTRWRYNVTRSLLVERFRSGKRVAAPLLRFRADDALAAAFPQAQACPETLPPGPIEVPLDHPLVAQTIHDCLHEAMDQDGFVALLHRIRNGTIALHTIDATQPSRLTEGILNAMPYAFLDDAPLEERRTQAVITQQRSGGHSNNELGSELDPAAVSIVQKEAWPEPSSAVELHEAMSWMGWLFSSEVTTAWRVWLSELTADGRVECENGRCFAAGVPRDPVSRWRGRLDAEVPIYADLLSDEDLAALRQLESEGTAMRAKLLGREIFGHRRLLARIRREMVTNLRKAIEPATQAEYEKFLPLWQGVGITPMRHGPRGLADTLQQMASGDCTAEQWENDVLQKRILGYQREQLDQLTLSGEFVWLRLWGSWRGPLSKAPLSILPRKDLACWLALPQERPDPDTLHASAQILLEILRQHGACFPTDLATQSRLLQSQIEDGLTELVGCGFATCDSFAAMRQLVVPPSKRRFPLHSVGRWSLIPWQPISRASDESLLHCARALLQRIGIVAYPLLLAERFMVPYRVLLRSLRALELSGEARGGRFVAGFSGEQFALPMAVSMLRAQRDPTAQTKAGSAALIRSTNNG